MSTKNSFYGGEKNSFYGPFLQSMIEERVLKKGPAQTVSFDEEQLVQLLSLIVNFYPIQSGNGQPSPENIRTISGRTFADVCISPTLDSEDGKIYHVEFPTQVGTAYGGTIDMINKTLTINYLYRTFTGQEDWEMFIPSKTVPYCRLVLGNFGSVVNDSGVCSHFPNKIINSSQLSVEDGSRIVNSIAIPYAIICIRYAEKQQTVDDFKDWLREQYNAGTPVQIAYKISNPTVYNIDIDPVILYPNDNNIWIENGDITIQYKINKNVYYNTANGNPCVLDKSVNTSITSLFLDIQPVQDLHGYDAPWPAGGGKNKYDLSVFTEASKNGVTVKANTDGTLTVTGTPTATADILLSYFINGISGQTYILNGAPTGGSNKWKLDVKSNSEYYVDSGNGVSFVADDSGSIQVRVVIYVEAGTNINLTFKPMIRLASVEDATFAPYSNICPITGWTGTKMIRCGKNLLKLTESEMENSGYNRIFPYTTAPGTFTISHSDLFGDNYGAQIGLLDSSNVSVKIIAASYAFGKGGASDKWNYSFTLTAEEAQKVAKIRFQFSADGATWANVSNAKMQIELGTTATSYEPYQGETYDITFPTEAGTVYGGTLDVTSGMLTVDRAMDTKKWSEFRAKTSLENYTRGYMSLSNAAVDVNPTDICNVAPFKYSWTSDDLHFYVNGPNARAFVWLPNDTDGNLDVSVCYELATPVTYQLTPTQINALSNLTILTTNVDDITATYKAKNK